MNAKFRTLCSLALAVISCNCLGASLDELRGEWAHVRYELPAGAQLEAMAALKARSDSATAAAPDSAELLVWNGIITSSLAGLKGGLKALSLAKEARATLEKAEKRQPGVLAGSALTSLGALYYQVPGWPVGFGDHDKARQLLESALRIDPDGIDSNYFYADFLLGEGDVEGARRAAVHAMAAPPRPGRELADNGRHAELRALMARIGSRARG